tara:strand:+ start:88881 stop:89279 length:399 start_codon:yes stop_codon:yes gene_type:complete
MDGDQPNFTVTHHDLQGYYEITLRHTITIDTVLAAQDAITGHFAYVNPANVMWDVRLTDLTDLTMQDMLGGLSRIGTRISNRAAVVFETDFQLAIARQAVTIAGADLDRVFLTNDYTAAQEWLDIHGTCSNT